MEERTGFRVFYLLWSYVKEGTGKLQNKLTQVIAAEHAAEVEAKARGPRIRHLGPAQRRERARTLTPMIPPKEETGLTLVSSSANPKVCWAPDSELVKEMN